MSCEFELFHSSQSRSSRVLWLLLELDIAFKLTRVSISRPDGTGFSDPLNPHPDGKVPALRHNDTVITESGAIMLYLTDLHLSHGLGVGVSSPVRGEFLSWIFWYGNVMEPVYLFEYCGLSEDQFLYSNFRSVNEVVQRLSYTLKTQPYLLGNQFTCADLLISYPFLMFDDSIPSCPEIKSWLDRCASRPAFIESLEKD